MYFQNKIRPPLYGQFASLYDSVPANDYLNYPKPLPREFEKCKDLIEKYVDAREVIPFMKANIEEDGKRTCYFLMYFYSTQNIEFYI